ncbi:MAG: type IV pilus assembly protein PilM [Candidatus Dojkabacteria bacterium]|jgi:type IV pilus assembly protein PilM
MATLPDHVGIDFGTHSVKAVELSGISTKNPKLVNLGSQATPKGAVNSEDPTDQKRLADSLKKLYEASGIKNSKVVMALPEFSVFTRFLELPGVKEEEMREAVYYEAKQYIPLPLSEVMMDYIPVGFNTERNAPRVLVVAASSKVVEIYVKIASEAGLDLLAIETESLAMGRVIYRSTGKKAAVMLDFGANNTDMSILADGYLVFSQSIAIGSDSLTQAIVNKFNFDNQRAEEFKRNYGVVPNVLEGKIYSVLTPIIESILVEVRRGMEFYKSRTLSISPSDYILGGDGALLPGISEYIAKSLNANVSLANPWNNIQIDANFEDIARKGAPSYSVAIGLALRDD